MSEGIVLVVRRTIRASQERIFDAWTRPEHLRVWWGPRPVTCSGAEVDLRVGGRYRIANTLPDGKAVIIEGTFRRVERPQILVYTWRMGQGETQSSLVTVRFEARGEATEVVIVHENLPSAEVHDSHEGGWNGCLDGLETFLEAGSS
jgi:uncharacterized protein YndB with AHSA1/START domain